MTYTYVPYPRRLYLNGEVIPGDLHATNSVVVNSEDEELEARGKGYRKAYEPIEKEESNGGDGGSDQSTPDEVAQDQGAVAGASAGPDDVEALRAQAKALGVKVHHKAGADKIREAIAQAGK